MKEEKRKIISKLKSKYQNEKRGYCERCGKLGYVYLIDETHFVDGRCKHEILKQNKKWK